MEPEQKEASEERAKKKARCSGEARQTSPPPWLVGAFIAKCFTTDKDMGADDVVAAMKKHFRTDNLPDSHAIMKFQDDFNLAQVIPDDDHLTGFIRPYMRPQACPA